MRRLAPRLGVHEQGRELADGMQILEIHDGPYCLLGPGGAVDAADQIEGFLLDSWVVIGLSAQQA